MTIEEKMRMAIETGKLSLEQGFSFKDRKDMQLFVTLEPCMMCYGKELLQSYIEAKKEGTLVDFCKTLINLN